MHKNTQKVERKTRTKISCNYTWLLHGKNCPSRRGFLRSFLTASKPSRRSITAAKRKENEKKERRKNFLISTHARVKMSQNAMLVARKPSCRVASAFFTVFDQIKANWAEIQPKTTKMSKKRLFSKKLRESMG